MTVYILTIFPEIFDEIFRCGVVGRALDRGIARIEVIDLRRFTTDVHRTVDDRPYGGGAGMVLKPEPICSAIDEIVTRGYRPYIVVLSPQGRLFTQQVAARYAGYEHLVLICGRYGGVDERITENVADEETSIGDFVLSGGELPAMVVVDSVVRLLPQVLGNEDSVVADSFSDGILGYPCYTRPTEYRGWEVPQVLLTGDHERIRKWRAEKALEKTRRNRSDLLDRMECLGHTVSAEKLTS